MIEQKCNCILIMAKYCDWSLQSYCLKIGFKKLEQKFMYGVKFSVMVYWCIFRFLKMFSLYISKCFRVVYFCSNDDNNNGIIKNVEFINK